MKTRVVAGVVAAVAVSTLVLFAPVPWLVVTVLVVAGWACMEFDRLFFPVPSKMRAFRGLSLVFLCLATLRHAPEMAWVFFWLPLLVLSIQHVMRANAQGQFEKSIRELSIELLGIFYVVCMVGFLMPIVESGPHGREYVLLLFFMVFAGDTFAYFVGTFWGKHRLATQISPKKSLEGAAGAVVGSLVFAGLWYGLIYSGPTSPKLVMALGVLTPLVSLFAQVGDLFESMLKRSCACKDSGHFLPGHGGILDRTDGLTLSAPAFYFFLQQIVGKL